MSTALISDPELGVGSKTCIVFYDRHITAERWVYLETCPSHIRTGLFMRRISTIELRSR
jgi:hypothetical protein